MEKKTVQAEFHSLISSRIEGQFIRFVVTIRGGGGTSYNGLYGEAPPKRGNFFRLQVYKREGISRAEVYERVGKSVI